MSPATYQRFTKAVLVYSCLIILSGATVRLTGSGLGCSKWPVCEPGELLGLEHQGSSIESLNRVFTSLIAIPGAIAVIASLFRVPRRRDLTLWSSLAVLSVFANAVLGGLSTIFDLHPAIVGGHFVLAMALVAGAVVLRSRALHSDRDRHDPLDRRQRLLLRLVTCLASVVLLTGVVITGSGPHAGDARAQRWDLDITTAAFMHSASVWVFLMTLLVTLFVFHRTGAPKTTVRHLTIAAWLCVAQGAIGYTQYFTGVPRWLVLAHIAGATAVWVSVIWTLMSSVSWAPYQPAPAEPARATV